MRLVAFSLESYRRFVAKTSVKLHGDMIAFVGPNEAGKSSLLRALAHLHKEGGFDANERPRRTSLEPRLAWHFQLEDDDKALLAEIPDAHDVQRAIVTKRGDGSRSWEFEPRRPHRDRSKRAEAMELMVALRDLEEIAAADVDEESEFDLGDFDQARETLEADVEDYGPDNLAGLADVARRVRMVASVEPSDEDESDKDQIEKSAKFEAARDAVADAIDGVVTVESERSPFDKAVNALNGRLPSIELFNEADRDLSSEHDLVEVAGSPPRALMHLAALAGLDLGALRDEATAHLVADVATRRNAANGRLLSAFDQSWNQQGIAIQIDVQGTILHIQATTPEDSGLSDIGERSDGMRWFAALLAFSHGWSKRPILLVDEIETHLHYDAQADLVDVLSKQRFTSKVIFTTHSFGCLPFDLGAGVRVVQPLDAATSRLENGFWRRGAGFSPLLASMGAAALSFTPTRHALIAEGAADAILLPTLLRQGRDGERLGFQVAPGLSSVAAVAVADLEAEAGRVGFVVDGDPGGKDILSKLVGAGIPEDRVLVLTDPDSGAPLEVEDLIDAQVYVASVNDELRCWTEVTVECTAADVGDELRTKALEAWCVDKGISAPDKAAVAQRVVDRSTDGPVHSVAREALLRSLLMEARSILEIAQ